MRTQILGAVACVAGFAAGGYAQPAAPTATPAQPAAPLPYSLPQASYPQYPPLNPANVMPNIYNPRTQPLSPYLNLLRSGNTATNYYYGVRPGTVGGAGSIGGAASVAAGGNRAAFLPQTGAGPDPFGSTEPVTGSGASALPPAGHPVVYGNTMGYFPGSFGGGRRPGLSGIGNTRPAAPRR